MGKYLLKLIVLLFASAGLVISQPAVDGFLKGKSNLDVALGATYESFSQYYYRLNDLTPVGRTSIAVSAFGAMGLTNWLDAQVNIPYIYTTTDFANLQDWRGIHRLGVHEQRAQLSKQGIAGRFVSG